MESAKIEDIVLEIRRAANYLDDDLRTFNLYPTERWYMIETIQADAERIEILCQNLKIRMEKKNNEKHDANGSA